MDAPSRRRRSTFARPAAARAPGVARAIGYVVEDEGPYSASLTAHEHRIDFHAYPLALYASPSFPYVIGLEVRARPRRARTHHPQRPSTHATHPHATRPAV